MDRKPPGEKEKKRSREKKRRGRNRSAPRTHDAANI